MAAEIAERWSERERGEQLAHIHQLRLMSAEQDRRIDALDGRLRAVELRATRDSTRIDYSFYLALFNAGLLLLLALALVGPFVVRAVTQ
jgi:hypothetical protein